VTPAERVREHLAASRADGVTFAAAWRAALEDVDWEAVPVKDREARRGRWTGRARSSGAYDGVPVALLLPGESESAYRGPTGCCGHRAGPAARARAPGLGLTSR